MDWEEAGIAWSDRAVDWAYLMEPLFTPIYEALSRSLALQPTESVLDMGCGGGRALQAYAAQGYRVAGIDAADGLLGIARLRVPQADLRHGSLTELPWPDGSFEAVTGVNSFVYVDDGGLSEAFRVLKPGGRLGIGFWVDPLDFGFCMAALGKALRPYVGAASTNTPLAMSEPGKARELLATAGFEVLDSGSVQCASEFADAETAYRGLASTGMIHPIVRADTETDLRAEVMDDLRSRYSVAGGIRMNASLGWVIAQRSR
jgi:SAM-dependent methyltransferase